MKTLFKKAKVVCSFLLVVAMVFSLSGENEALAATSKMRAYTNNPTFTGRQTTGYLSIFDAEQYTAVCQSNWVHFDGNKSVVSGTSQGSWKFTMDLNTTGSTRVGTFVVIDVKNGASKVVNFTQTSVSTRDILNVTKGLTNTAFPYSGGRDTIEFTAGCDWTICSSSPRVIINKSVGVFSTSTQSVNIEVLPSQSTSKESYVITLTCGNVVYERTITQEGAPEFYNVYTPDLPSEYEPRTATPRSVYFFEKTYNTKETSGKNGATITFYAAVPWKFTSAKDLKASKTSGGPGLHTIYFTGKFRDLSNPKDLYDNSNPQNMNIGFITGQNTTFAIVLHYTKDVWVMLPEDVNKKIDWDKLYPTPTPTPTKKPTSTPTNTPTPTPAMKIYYI